jgi:hypothetical protein
MTIRVIVRKYFFIFMNDCDEIIAPPNFLLAKFSTYRFEVKIYVLSKLSKALPPL